MRTPPRARNITQSKIFESKVLESKIRESKAFYAVAGAGDLAKEKLRQLSSRIASTEVDTKDVQGKVVDRLAELRGDARHLPEKVQELAKISAERASSVYGELAERGKGVVARTRGEAERATPELEAEPTTGPTTEAKSGSTTSKAKTSSEGRSRSRSGSTGRSRTGKATSG